jgi:hypothetical protein
MPKIKSEKLVSAWNCVKNVLALIFSATPFAVLVFPVPGGP